MRSVLTSLALAFRQLADGRVLAILAKSIAVTLGLFVILGWIGWHSLDWALDWVGLGDSLFWGAESARGIASLALTLIGGWLLWRILAMAVIQFYASDVVKAVERRHYPEDAENARDLTLAQDFQASLKGSLKALGINLLVLPIALILLVTGIGTAILFWVVNAFLIGRELHDMVWLRHKRDTLDIEPASRSERFLLGGAIAGLLLLPFANFLAPVIGAAGATHLIHTNRRDRNDA
jgi:uncharacterized protein involved in cysteine biosynthesis